MFHGVNNLNGHLKITKGKHSADIFMFCRSFSDCNAKPNRTRPSQVTLDKDKLAASSSSTASGVLPMRVDLNKVREAKRFVVLQAQHEGCLGSYKSFDSLFGNYLIPVIPGNDFFDQIGTK